MSGPNSSPYPPLVVNLILASCPFDSFLPPCVAATAFQAPASFLASSAPAVKSSGDSCASTDGPAKRKNTSRAPYRRYMMNLPDGTLPRTVASILPDGRGQY